MSATRRPTRYWGLESLATKGIKCAQGRNGHAAMRVRRHRCVYWSDRPGRRIGGRAFLKIDSVFNGCHRKPINHRIEGLRPGCTVPSRLTVNRELLASRSSPKEDFANTFNLVPTAERIGIVGHEGQNLLEELGNGDSLPAVFVDKRAVDTVALCPPLVFFRNGTSCRGQSCVNRSISIQATHETAKECRDGDRIPQHGCRNPRREALVSGSVVRGERPTRQSSNSRSHVRQP